MRRIVWLIVPVLLLGLLAVAMFATRQPSPTTAFTLRPGDCFDIPTDAQVGDIATLDCMSPHDAEVFVANALTTSPTVSASASASDAASPSASSSTLASAGLPAYPGGSAIAAWVSASCGMSAQQAYLGADATTRPDLVVGYFFPTADAWTHGERQVTCYLHTVGSKLSAPLRGAGSSASPS
jgi:Septum formation